MTAVADFEGAGMKREASLLNLICLIGAIGLFAFIAYNFIAAGDIFTVDGLFFTVVPLVLALCFLVVPFGGFALKKLEQRKGKKAGGETSGATSSAGTTALPRSSAPALKDAQGRAMPPDVNRMVESMKIPAAKKE